MVSPPGHGWRRGLGRQALRQGGHRSVIEGQSALLMLIGSGNEGRKEGNLKERWRLSHHTFRRPLAVKCREGETPREVLVLIWAAENLLTIC